MKKGGSEHSFGIHVASMAGIPKPVIKRADAILKHLENDRSKINATTSIKKVTDQIQMNLFQVNDPKMTEVLSFLNNLDVNNLTPIESLMKLNEIKQILED